ncbi:MAG: hypothetical protein IKO62_10505 [Bacteroidales bacterium]|nr:hypothetical protein [Bacteroidales bacterium]
MQNIIEYSMIFLRDTLIKFSEARGTFFLIPMKKEMQNSADLSTENEANLYPKTSPSWQPSTT